MPEQTAPLGESRLDAGSLIVNLTDDEKGLLANQIERLFVIHDKRLSKNGKAILTDELAHLNIPFRFLIAGLRDLEEEENLKNIELWRIKNACRKRMHAEYRPASCESCGTDGTVTMIYKDGERRGIETQLACICPNGDRWARGSSNFRALVRWNGLAEQRHGIHAFILWPRNEMRPRPDPE